MDSFNGNIFIFSVSQARLPLQSPTHSSQASQRNSVSTQGALSRQPSPMNSPALNPFIYGTDVDSVDVATRVAMVSSLCVYYNFRGMKRA